MTNLFGTVEYFKEEIVNSLGENGLAVAEKEQVLEIWTRLENELRNDFVCAETIRKECLDNLTAAGKSFLEG